MNKNIEAFPHGESATAIAENQLPAAQWSITSLNPSDDQHNSTIVIALTGTFNQGEIITVDLGLTHAHSTIGSYTDILTVISIAVAANSDLSFNILTDKLTYTSPSNGASMTNLRVDLPMTKDQFINTPENYSLRLANPTASTDARVEVNPALADITISNDDSQASEQSNKAPGQLYVTDLVTAYRATNALTTESSPDALKKNEALTVEGNLTDSRAKIHIQADFQTTIDTPVTIAPSTVNEPETFTPRSDGTTANTTNLPLASDGLNIRNDRHRQGASDAFIFKNSNNATDLRDNKVSSVFTSARTAASPDKDPGLWSITGPATVANGDNAVFVVSLGGFYQVGERISADINLMGIDTNSDDFIDAVLTAVENNPGVSFDGTTLTYTAPDDGAAMTDLIIVLNIGAAAITQMTCLFSVGLTRPTGNTFTPISITPGAQSVTTYVNAASSSIVDSNSTMSNRRLAGCIRVNNGNSDNYPLTVLLVNGKLASTTVTTAAAGSIVVDSNGTYIYSPADNFVGQDNINIKARDAAGNFVSSVLSIEVSDVMSCQRTDPNPAPTGSHDHVSLIDSDDSKNAALTNKTESSGNSEIPTKIDSVISSNTEELLHTINRITGVNTPDMREPGAIPITELSTPLSPHDHHAIDASPAIQPADQSMTFSVSKDITDTTSSIAGDHCGKILFESFITGDVINIHVSNTIGDQCNGISSYSATVRNGQSLPDWINFTQDGLFIINRSIDEEVITLRLIATRNSGDRTAVLFETNTLTGEVFLSEKNYQSTTRTAAAYA